MTLEIITARPLAPLRHGFFTRKGGASSGVYAGLNCGAGSADQTEAVRINKARVARALGVNAHALVGMHQTHSADVAHVDGPQETPPRADALVTTRPELALAVLTADCQPVLLADAAAGVVGAAHAGWRGALAGILEATVDAMVAAGAERERVVAVVGPTISQAAYEVGPEVFEVVTDEAPEAVRFFAQGEGDRMLFDLPGYGVERLRAAGIGRTEWTRHCTYSDPTRFFSYRRATHRKEPDYGRLISAIRL